MNFCIVQARTSSQRLPQKVLKDLNGVTVLEYMLRRVLKSQFINRTVVATSTDPSDDIIVDICNNLNVTCFRGSLHDVLDRYYQCARFLNAANSDLIIRLTADCPLIDPKIIDSVIEAMVACNYDYISNALNPTFPDGQDVAIAKYSVLEHAWKEAKLPSDREHVFPWVEKNSSIKGGTLFQAGEVLSAVNLSHFRMTIDEPRDYEFLLKLTQALSPNATLRDYIDYLSCHSEIFEINANITRNEGYFRSLQNDKL